MPKRYHQTRKDRAKESLGEKHYMQGVHAAEAAHDESARMAAHKKTPMYKHGRDKFNDEFYNDQDAHARAYYRTGGNLSEDRNAVANLPQQVVYKPYGDPVGYLDQNIDDTIGGIDYQRGYDMRKAKEHFYPKKV